MGAAELGSPQESQAGTPRPVEVVWTSAASLAALAGALYLTQVASLPRALRQDLDDTASHFGLGVLVTGCLICLVYSAGLRNRRLLIATVVVTSLSMVFLVGTELLQAPSITRQPEVGDAVADIAGAGVIATILLAAFHAPSPVPRLAAMGFTSLASVALVAAAVLVAVSPPAPVRERSAVELAVGLAEELDATVMEANPCISISSVAGPSGADDGRSTPTLPSEPTTDPLLRFDLDKGLDQVDGSLIPLQLAAAGSTELSPGVGAIFAGGQDGLASLLPADDLLTALSARQSFSVEVWMDLDALPQFGPARIVTLSAGTRRDQSIFHLGVEGDQLSVRFRTECDPTNWILVEGLSAGLHHVVFTFDRGEAEVFIDGRLRAAYRLEGSDLNQWSDPVPLNIGNEATGNRGLRGVVSVVSFWPDALSEDEVAWLASEQAPRPASEP